VLATWDTELAFETAAEPLALEETPVYETTVIAAKMPITTITTKSSTIVESFLLI